MGGAPGTQSTAECASAGEMRLKQYKEKRGLERTLQRKTITLTTKILKKKNRL